jgi:hypothetical protein
MFNHNSDRPCYQVWFHKFLTPYSYHRHSPPLCSGRFLFRVLAVLVATLAIPFSVSPAECRVCLKPGPSR